MATALTALLLTAGWTAQGSDLGADEFSKLHASLFKPERWASVPWRGNLLEARAAAARDGKPVFIWAMDGKPLGSV